MKRLWLLLLVLILTGCGIFKKDKHVERVNITKEYAGNIQVTAGVTHQGAKINTEFEEIVIKGTKKRDKKNIDTAEDIDDLHAAIVRAIDNSEETIYRRSKTSDSSYKDTDTTKTLKSVTSSSDSSQTVKDVHKDSNTTLAANFPWYAWVIGAILVFGIVWLLLKKAKIL